MQHATPTVYIPTLAGGERLASCLESLRSQSVPATVVVADNGDGDGCRDLLASRYPEVVRIGFGKNLGFGPALNCAIDSAGEGPIILLNDDARAAPKFVESLLARSKDAEMVAGVMVDGERNEIIDSAGVIVDRTLMGFDYLHGLGTEALEQATPPMGPTGGGALYNRDAFKQVGGFDDHIFLYYEDVDLALRIRALGGRCSLAGDARATHGYSETLGSGSPRKYAMTGWSRGYLLRKYGVMRDRHSAIGVITQEAVVCAGQILRRRTTAGLRGRLKGWQDQRGAEVREIPKDATSPISTLSALELRLRRSRT